MVEPFVPLMSPIVSGAVTLAKRRLDEARATDRSQAERVVAYLRAIAEAVKGLEAEADELLSQCRWMDWSDESARGEFLSRCRSYLDVDHLRLELSEALQGLDASREVLRERADALLQRPGKKAQRKALLSDIEETQQVPRLPRRAGSRTEDERCRGLGIRLGTPPP
jgi:hypothetical protein